MILLYFVFLSIDECLSLQEIWQESNALYSKRKLLKNFHPRSPRSNNPITNIGAYIDAKRSESLVLVYWERGGKHKKSTSLERLALASTPREFNLRACHPPAGLLRSERDRIAEEKGIERLSCGLESRWGWGTSSSWATCAKPSTRRVTEKCVYHPLLFNSIFLAEPCWETVKNKVRKKNTWETRRSST